MLKILTDRVRLYWEAKIDLLIGQSHSIFLQMYISIRHLYFHKPFNYKDELLPADNKHFKEFIPIETSGYLQT